MLDSMFKKMFALCIATIMLVIFVVISFAEIGRDQSRTQRELDQVVDLQLCVDLLRSQLWVYTQFDDQQSLTEVEFAHADLTTKLTQYGAFHNRFDNIQNMNRSLRFLLDQEKEVYFREHVSNKKELAGNLQARGFIHARYNMIIQNMTEELARVSQLVLERNSAILNQVLTTAAFGLLLWSLVVSAVAWIILYRFGIGMRVMKEAIWRITKGDFTTKVEKVAMDRELRTIAIFLNRMTLKLQKTTVSKCELEREVQQQTEQIRINHEKLIYQSEHDPLTGLLNRRAFDAQLDLSLSEAARTQQKLAILFIDLDQFKSVNDAFGHDVGDTVLTVVAKRLQDTVRSTDFVARLGGDEFVICLDRLNDHQVVTKKMRQIQASIRKPILFGERKVYVGASIGCSRYPEQSKSRDRLISIADKGMYKDKKCLVQEEDSSEPKIVNVK